MKTLDLQAIYRLKDEEDDDKNYSGLLEDD